MLKNIILVTVLSGLLIFSAGPAAGSGGAPSELTWKAGTARSVITPQKPVWLAGYESRTHPSDGILTDLWARVLAIQDSKGKKAVLITTDLLGFPKGMSDRIRNQIAIKYGLTRSQIILSYSHTHSGPVLADALYNIYPLDEQQLGVISEYSASLEKKIVELTGQAIRNMVPAEIWSGNGITRFQVNRRNNKESSLDALTALNGPNDYAVPVLRINDLSGNMIAVAFGYACHATVLNIYKISGDYPGFAEMALEKSHPGLTAMFFQGAGADQNPLPRRTIPLAVQYGSELAAAVERVLSENMNKLEPVLKTAYSEVDLAFSTPPSRDELVKIEKESEGYQKKWASNQLQRLRDYGSLLSSYPYPVEVWKLGSQVIMALGGELTVKYSILLKGLFGQGIFVMGYVNDDMAYIPSETILSEGGYEGESSQRIYGLPTTWAPGIENRIIGEMKKLARRAGVEQVSEQIK